MSRRLHATSFALAAALILASACSTSEEPIDVDPYERPGGARDLITDAELAILEDVGAVVFGGENPPELAGVYDRAGGEVIYHDRSEIEGTPLCYNIWTVEATTDPARYTLSSENYNNCSGSSEGVGSYVSGDGDCFTLYVASAGERDGCEHYGVGITSGCVTSDGITEMISAGLAGERISVEAGACEALINDGLLGAEGERDVLYRGFVERVE